MDRLPSKLPFSKKRLRARVVISYIADYVIIIACVIGFYILDSIEPFHQHFSLRDITLQYPYAVHERVPIQDALLISLVFPAVVIVIYTLFIDGLFSHKKPSTTSTSGRRKLSGTYRWKDRLWELNCGILGLLLSQAMAFVITQILKNACGRPRPDLIDRCKPSVTTDPTPLTLSDYSICTGDKALLKDGFRSWPSGHSSSSFAGLLYLSLYLCGKLHVMDNRGEVWKLVIVVTPLMAASLIAVSRIMDARHHPFDVISGSLLGVFCAWASYGQYFPPITQPWKKGRAYSIRTWATAPIEPVAQIKPYGDSNVALRNPDEERLETGVYLQPERSNDLSVPSGVSVAPTPPAYENNPFGPGAYNRRRREGDEYSSSSSEDVTDGYEMHEGYTRTANYAGTEQAARYEPDTTYHSPAFQGDHLAQADHLGARPLT
ncbi:hypothetical protein DTO195F2_4596 [Paecilomyces variotii]|nr:hypothetical protein DTO195F2_4596 [Paecilomyces variotii]KAJ9310009.1 hypothetical protein DTO217A2_295 [Paecilomyces variotii]KAJ9368027.1 hypothetical protein DTO282E5_7337 [Paecilomyces variotii]